MSAFAITEADPGSAEALALVAALLDELEPLYQNLWSNPFDPNELRIPGRYFVVARHGGDAVGCGGIRPLTEGVAEVRRMYVVPAARGHGVAQLVLGELETAALQLGYRVVRLETGVYQPAAIRLYERVGYRHIAAYGAYVGDPLSVCFEKCLSD